jgi:tetratricopeptide (TPR) repeat protein
MEACKQALSVSPGNLQALSMLGHIHASMQDYETAKMLFHRLITIAPAKASAYYDLGSIYRLEQNHKSAQEAFEAAVARDPEHLHAFVNLVESLIAQGKHQQAIMQCDERIRQFKGNSKMLAPVYDLKGRLMMIEDQPFEAEQFFKKSILHDENHLPAYYSLAELYVKEGRAQKAIENFKTASRNNTDKVMVPMMLGILNYMLQNDEQAITHYHRALEINPDFAAAANNLAYLLAEKEKDLNQALELAQRAKAQMPEDPRVGDTLGWVYFKMGLYDAATREFSASLEKLPGNPTILYHLAMTYYKKGNKEQAKSTLEKAWRFSDRFENAEQARNILAELKSDQNSVRIQ